MTTTSSPLTPTPSQPGRGPVRDIVQVTLPTGGLSANLRAVKVVWKRELLRFFSDKLRIFTSLLQPILFLFVLGTGLSSIAGEAGEGVDYRTFMFPGAVSMAVLFTALFSAGSIVWDREFGFMREMLVAPISRGSIVLGKSLGGATVASFQGLIMLALAGLVGVPYNPSLLITVAFELMLLSFTLTAFGVMLAAKITNIQTFMALTQMLLMPLFFLSGALYPLSNLPGWLQALTHINPLTYAVDPIRRAVFSHLDVPASVNETLNPGVMWGSWQVPTAVELGMVAALGLIAFGVAVWEFRKAE